MSAKSNRFRDLARYKMFAGANMLADAVKVTPGSKGRNAIMGRSRGALTKAEDRVSFAGPGDPTKRMDLGPD